MMKKILNLLIFLFAGYNTNAQKFVQKYQDAVNLVSQNNINLSLKEFEAFGVKTTGSVNNNNTLQWIRRKYLSYGYSENQITEDPFYYEDLNNKIYSSNLIITKKGTLYPDIHIIICGHFDTISGPGVNDNGSGTSIILEAARILKDMNTEYSVTFIHFSGEEQRGKGSSHYVSNVVYVNGLRKLNIKLVINLDQVGGKKGNKNTRIYCERDENELRYNNRESKQITRQLIKCTNLYSPLRGKMAPAYNSDYMAFEKKGEIITGLYEYIESGNEHTVNDTYENIDTVYVFNVCKATLGAIQHFSAADK